MTATDRAALDLRGRKRIDRRWPRWRWTPKGESRWASFDERYYAVILAGACILVAGFVEIPWLAHHQTPPPQFEWFGRNLLLLVPANLLNAWVLNPLIATRTPRRREFAPALRACHSLALGVPVLGLAAIPFWRNLVIARPKWALQLAPAAPRALSLHEKPSLLLLRGDALLWISASRFPALAAWVIVCQVLPCLTFANWLAAEAPHRPHLAFAILAGLHGVTAVCGWVFAKAEIEHRQISGGRAIWLRLSPLFFLFPVPLMLLGAVSWIPLGSKVGDDGSLSETLYSHRARQARGQRIAAADREPDTGRSEDTLRKVALGLSLLGLPVGAWVGGAIGAFGFELTESGSIGLFYSCLAGLALAGVLGLLRPLEGFGRLFPSLERTLRPPFLLLSSLAPVVFLCGVYLGWLAARGDWKNVGSVLQSLGIAGAILLFVATIGIFARDLVRARSAPSATIPLLLMIGGMAIAVLGVLIERGRPENIRSAAITLAQNLAVAALPLHLVLGLTALGPLLHPYRLAHLFDRRLPRSLRARLAGLAATALVPLAGLPAPWWIWNRRQLGNADARTWWEKVGRLEGTGNSKAAVRSPE